MSTATERLLAYQGTAECYSVSDDEVRDLQIAAIDERLQDRIDKIDLVGLRAREAGIDKIESLQDVVPLLLPHTAYKSYPESFLNGEKWDKLSKWLSTVSSASLDKIGLDNVDGIDGWVSRLEEAGYYLSCSSGTTGKAAMLLSSPADLAWPSADNIAACTWATGLAPAQDRLFFSLAPVAKVARNDVIKREIARAYGKPENSPFSLPTPPITIGSILEMIGLRKAIADGTASPSMVAEYETKSHERETAIEHAIDETVDALIAARGEKLFLMGMWGPLYQIAVRIRERGFSAKDFQPHNMMYVGGGLKRAAVPDNYREVVYDTFAVDPAHNYQLYSMQEINTVMPRCHEGGRYHVPPWLVCLTLNQDGDELVDNRQGEVRGRACFFDLSMDARWGGVISGDRIDVDFSPCKCGARSPSIRDNVVRYADLEGDDKIRCSGTVDAYVRGVA
ncbi:MAG: hypothetical protein KDE55_03415 [Novosphingobium sp.]|nr:hypothetical protein [Novosphingobium sp.]